MNETKDNAAEEVWQRAKAICLAMSRSDEEKSQSERHLSRITGVMATSDGLYEFETSNDFATDLLTREYSEKVKNCLMLAGAKVQMVKFKTDEKANYQIVNTPIAPRQNPTTQVVARPVTAKASTFISTMPLNEAYTFEEFVEGPSNSWALAAAQGVSQKPGEKEYNPLFIHGGTGLGKTHLMQAIGNAIRKNSPELSVCYLTAETFLNEYVNSLQNGLIQSFRDKYRTIDVLLVDDVQFIQKGHQFQEEFFNTFNVLTGAQKQIVMTSDVAPKNLPEMEERLISRFEGGMVQEIELPSYETRLAILQKKSEGRKPAIPDMALKFIAENIKSHVRAMEGALMKVKVMLSQNPSLQMGSDILTRLLKDLIEKEQTIKKLTVSEIQAAVAKKYSVTIEQIMSSERTQSLVTPRQLAMYIARKYTTKSLKEIGPLFDKKHATILHGVKTIEKRLDVEEDLKVTLNEILAEFGLKPEES